MRTCIDSSYLYNDERAQRIPEKHFPDHNAFTSSLERFGKGCRMFASRDFPPYSPTSICPMEHKTRFIGKRYLSSLSGCPIIIWACKFQSSLPMNSSQLRYMNQTSASKAITQQRSLNNSLEDTVGSPLVHLDGQLLNCITFIHPNSSPQPSFFSVIYSPWWTTFTK
ncbi:hypothetical protein TNCV_2360631 [Trichonephila clavipes]|nr:hypothetical protein TNCV_2360631 [Trichonephila clavipes]